MRFPTRNLILAKIEIALVPVSPTQIPSEQSREPNESVPAHSAVSLDLA